MSRDGASEKKYSLAQNAWMNTAGTLVYYVCQWAVSMVVVRLSTDENVGMLQLAMTVTNVFMAVALYNMRPYQVSDVRDDYTAGQYTASRILTCALAMAGCAVYSICWGYGGRSFWCIQLYMIYRINEAAADVLHGVDQKHDRMDHVGISQAVRGVLMLLVFTLLIRWTDNILISVAAMACVTLLFAAVYDVSRAGRYDDLRPDFRGDAVRRLLWACLPGALASIAVTSIVTVPRQYLAQMEGEIILGYYATVATPLVFLQVLVNSVISPAVGSLSRAAEREDRRAFVSLTGKLLALILAFSGAVFLGVCLLGEWGMVLLFGEKIRPYVSWMYAVVGCVAAFAVCSLGQQLLIVLRSMRELLLFSVLALLVSACTGKALIRLAGPDGVSMCVTLSYLLFALLSMGKTALLVRRWNPAQSADG